MQRLYAFFLWSSCFNFDAAPPAMAFQNNQGRIITGTVTDGTTGETLPGVNVIIKGSTVGTVSNMDREFSLQAPGPESVLVFFFYRLHKAGNYCRQPK